MTLLSLARLLTAQYVKSMSINNQLWRVVPTYTHLNPDELWNYPFWLFKTSQETGCFIGPIACHAQRCE